MTMFYSPAKAGFYTDAIHQALPVDAVQITDALYKSLMAGQSSGQAIVMASGLPALQPIPVTAAALIAYANARQVALRDGGIIVNVGSASTPDNVNVASDANGRTLVTGCVQLIGVASSTGQPAPTFQWINNDGTQLALTAAQMMSVALKLGTFVQATYSTLGVVLNAITAGTITTMAAIDTPPAAVGAWPATAY